MAASKESTREAVHRVANEILREGKLPTGREVHSRIGTGSFQTIYSELEKWARTTADRNALPDIPGTVRDGFVTLWEAAIQSAAQTTQPQLNLMSRQLEDKDHQIELLTAQLSELNESQTETNLQREQAVGEVVALQSLVSELMATQTRNREQISDLQEQVILERNKAANAQEFFQLETSKAEAQFRALEDKTLQELDQARQAMRLKVEALETAARREQVANVRQKESHAVQLQEMSSKQKQLELLIREAHETISGLREALGIARARETQLDNENTFLKDHQATLTALLDKIKIPFNTSRSRTKING